IDALGQHWERARVDADITDRSTVHVETDNVRALTLAMPASLCPLDNTHPPRVFLDGQSLEAPPVLSDRSWTAHFRKSGDRRSVAGSRDDGSNGLAKRHGLQGPIDDAFLDRFLIVRPTGKAMNEKIAAWTKSEMDRAIEHWRRQFRGEALVKDDKAVT